MGSLLVLFLAAGAISPDVATERIWGPEIPGKYKHPASITELKNGDLYLVYYGGDGEYADSKVYGTRKPKDATKWTAPELITPQPKTPEGNAVVWQAPDGLVWLFSVTRHGKTWSSSRIVFRTSEDNAATWSAPADLTTEAGTMVRGGPIVLANGDYLLPIYHETGEDPEFTARDTCSLFLRYDVKAKKWTESNRIKSRKGNLQPAAVAISADHLICYCRRAGDYLPTKDGYLVRSESHDGGRTWAPGTDSRFPNPNAAVDFLRLNNGHLMLVYNDSMDQRTPLTIAVSTDNDKSYPYHFTLAEGRGDYAYPYAIQTKDGKVHVVYTNRREIILHAIFDEEAIVRGRIRPAQEKK